MKAHWGIFTGSTQGNEERQEVFFRRMRFGTIGGCAIGEQGGDIPAG